MPVYYVDSAGSNTAPYDTWAKAAQSPNTIEAIIAAGDTVYLRGTFAGMLTLVGSGTGPLSTTAITYIGCHADGTPYGGQYTITATGNNFGISCASKVFRIYHNITCQSATYDGFVTIGNNNYFRKCRALTNGRMGWNLNATGTSCLWENCVAANNTQMGWYQPTSSTMIACYAYNNTTYGFATSHAMQLIHCGAWDNDTDNVIIYGNSNLFANCFFHASSAGSGINVSNVAYFCRILGCAFTQNNQYGIEGNAANVPIWENYNGFYLNGVGARLNCPTGINSGNFTALPYVNAAGGDFSTSDTAEFRRVLIPLSVTDETINKMYLTTGLTPTDIAGAGGGGTKTKMGEILGIKRGIF